MPLTLGPLTVPVPVVLAPMAGITNAAYRRLCAEQGAGLYVCEMITSRGLVERDATTLKMLVFDEPETTRSVQLYGTDPAYVGKATEILCAEYGVHHVDLNFGCPVPKVTRKGGGGALPWKRGLLADILRASVAAAAPYDVPVTMKTRKGLDDDHLTYLDAGRIAEDSGVAAIALHGRTVAQAYSRPGRLGRDRPPRRARRHPGARQRRHLGGRRRAPDGRADRRRRCRRRPRLPGPAVAVPRPRRGLLAAAGGRRPVVEPDAECRPPCRRLGEVADDDAPARRAAQPSTWARSAAARSSASTSRGTSRASGPAVELRHSLALVDSLAALDALLADLDPDEPFPVAELGSPRGRQGSPRERVVLPEGWLDDTDGSSLRLTEDASETTGG